MNREDRYWAKVDRRGERECWPWRAFRNPFGYGMFRGGDEQLAHRFGYRLAHGDIPPGMSVCHRCDNPACQNPNHLFVGTHAENMADMSNKGRSPGFSAPGEANSRARLSATAVASIRDQYAAGATQRELSEQYGVGQQAISKIVRADRWLGAEVIDGSKRRATRGAGHPQAKLSEEQVATIRERYASGGVSQAALGREFGVSQATVSWLIRQNESAPRVS